MSSKTISVNPDFLKGGDNNNKTQKRKKKLNLLNNSDQIPLRKNYWRELSSTKREAMKKYKTML